MTHKEHLTPVLSGPENTLAEQHDAQVVKQPFVEPKLTWIEPKLVQQGQLTAAAQSGGFFGSFSP